MNQEVFLFIAIAFLFILFLGRLIEKVRVPWIFAALFLGSLLAAKNPFEEITNSEIFTLLAQMGMYFLLFLVGLELNIENLARNKGFILRSAFIIIALETILGAMLVHFVFQYSWTISVLIALSFATVGEAILVPILDEFRILNTKLGQTIIGIGTIDDILEVGALVFAVFLIGAVNSSQIIIIVGSLAAIFILTFLFTRISKEGATFSFPNIETLFFYAVLVFFLYIGLGSYAEAAPLAALLAGISLRLSVPKERLELIENEIKAITYGLFGPIFFLWVGISMDINYLASYPLLVLLVVLVSKGAKLLGSYLTAKNFLGVHQSILLGIGLSVRFSTSIIIIKILLENGIVGSDIYSVIVASSIVFKFIIPFLFAHLIKRWQITPVPT